jgi:ribosomal-protein-alanine N-acetyltransferase
MRRLATARLDLEPLEARHALEMFSVLGDPSLYRFIDESVPAAPDTLEERYQMLEGRGSPDGRERWLNWIVRERASGGAIGYVQATVGDDAQADVAYVFAAEAQGQGYARESVRAMMAELAGAYGVSTCRARVDARNLRSIRLLQALEFERVGTNRGDDLFAISPVAPGSPRSHP